MTIRTSIRPYCVFLFENIKLPIVGILDLIEDYLLSVDYILFNNVVHFFSIDTTELNYLNNNRIHRNSQQPYNLS